MAYKIILEDNRTRLVITLSGSVTDVEFNELWRETAEVLTQSPTIFIIIADYSEAQLSSITVEGAREASHWPRELARFHPNILMISILKRRLEFGIVRMWAGFFRETTWNKVFVRSWDECREVISRSGLA